MALFCSFRRGLAGAVCGLLLVLLACDVRAANVRTAGPFIGSQRGGTVTMLDDGRIVSFGGGNAAIWNPERRQWIPSREAELQPRRYLHTATVVGNERIVFAGGLDAYSNRYGQQTALSSVTLWRPKQSTWEAGPGLLGPRFAHAAVALPGGDVLVIGGAATADRDEPFGTFLATVERLGDKTTTTRAPMAFARVRHTATVLPDGRVMVIGGLGDDRTALNSVEIYDANSNKWLPGPPLAKARAGHTATLLADGRVLVAGGADADGAPVARAEIWSSGGEWHDAGELLLPRSEHAATVLKDGSVLLSGGVAYGLRFARTLERWHADTNEWTVAGEAPLELRDHRAALQPDGSVLLFGSDLYNSGGVVLVWLPDEPEQQHLDAVIGASLTELDDGRILLAGGSRRQSSSASASLYDVKTNRWVAVAPLHFARSGHRALRLADGRVLVSGGQVTDDLRRAARRSEESREERVVPLGEIWNPRTNRWTVTDDIGALAELPRAEPAQDIPGIAPDTRWSGLVGIVKAADGKTYAFRNADVPGRSFPRLEAVWLNSQANRWQPNTNGYVERELPAMLALSDTEIMVAGGASAVVQIFNTAANEWRYTGWLPVPMRAPSILSLRDGGVMLAGRSMERDATVVCALWNPATSVWSECGRFTSDATGERRPPVLRDLGTGQTLLVYGNEQALVRGADGTWVATKLDFPKGGSTPYPNDDPIAYTTDLGGVWNPLEQRWVDATDVLFAHRYNMQVTRTPDRRWIFASRGSVLAWQSHERVFSRLSLLRVPENNLDSAVPINDGCAVMWNNTRELSYPYNGGAYVPGMFARNFTAGSWTSGIDAPSAPVAASALLMKGRTLLLAGTSRDAIGGGAEWQQYRVSCDQVLALAPTGASLARALYLPTRPPSAEKAEPVKAAAPVAPPPQLSYLETWRATALGLARSVQDHIQGTLVFGGVVLLLLMRLANRWGTYHVEEDGRTPGRVIDLAVLGVSACALVAVIGVPWPLVRTLGLVVAASIIVFAAKRLWTNIESRRDKVLYGVPLGAGALLCALAIGSVIISRLYAIIDSLRDY